MITEDYVSFETAKLLKEKGFDEPCIVSFFDKDSYREWIETAPRPLNIDGESTKPFTYQRPTLQMAMKWLRKVHCIFIYICPDLNEELIDGNHTGMYQEMLYSFNVGQWGEHGWHDIPESSNYMSYCTYEEACEAAIKYCLENLI